MHGFHALHSDKNEPLIEADRRQWWERWGNEHCKNTKNHTEQVEETAGEGSESGFSGVALARKATLFLGVTEEDIRTPTNRFLIYSAALVGKGQLPSLAGFMNK